MLLAVGEDQTLQSVPQAGTMAAMGSTGAQAVGAQVVMMGLRQQVGLGFQVWATVAETQHPAAELEGGELAQQALIPAQQPEELAVTAHLPLSQERLSHALVGAVAQATQELQAERGAEALERQKTLTEPLGQQTRGVGAEALAKILTRQAMAVQVL